MFKYLSMLCAVLGIIVYNTSFWSLLILALGCVFGVLSIKKKRSILGILSFIVNGMVLIIGFLVFLVILSGQLYIWKFY
ncbi:hypothetical protein D7Z54_19980 [Salibacterium salarium]|uniref:Uncharacterized protein n=1 Tax=Salibacterium salarium TaxID=284579 RepID=A0A428MZD9_9BACI|nr:hypothetical protein [Salibacterium salarium]RSL31521.1 hypothetical protein D7Z54_19980 [Salibacterium salarium]